MILENDFQYFDYKSHILYYIVKNWEFLSSPIIN